MSLKKLSIQKMKSFENSIKNPKNMKDVKIIESMSDILQKSLTDTLRKNKINVDQKTEKKELCLFLSNEFTKNELIEIIVHVDIIENEINNWRLKKEKKEQTQEILKEKSISELCFILEEKIPELDNNGYFIFFKNYVKNIKKRYIIGGISLAALVGFFNHRLFDNLFNSYRNQMNQVLDGVGKHISIPNLIKDKVDAINDLNKLSYFTHITKSIPIGFFFGTLPSALKSFKYTLKHNKKKNYVLKMKDYIKRKSPQLLKSIKKNKKKIQSIKKKNHR